MRTREALRKFILRLAISVRRWCWWSRICIGSTRSQSVLDEVVRTASESLLLICSFRPQFEPIWAMRGSSADLRSGRSRM